MYEKQNSKLTFIFGLVTGLAIFGIIGFGLMYAKLKPTGVEISENPEILAEDVESSLDSQFQGPPAFDPGIAGVSTFADSGDPICKDEGLPVVYMFSTTWCSFSTWAKEPFDSAVKDYIASRKIKAYHWEIDTGDNTLTPEIETQVPADHLAIYEKFNPQGSIPTFVFGCKYYRVGTGHEQTDDQKPVETAEFRALIESMID